MIQKSKIQEVHISELKPCPINVVLSSLPLIQFKSDNYDPEDVGMVHVGKLNDVFYIISGYDEIEVAKCFGLQTIPAKITSFSSKSNLIAKHVSQNIERLNIMKMFEVIDYFFLEEINAETAIKLCGLDATEYALLHKIKLEEKQIIRLKKLLEDLAEKHIGIRLPFYILSVISKITSSKQHYLTSIIVHHVMRLNSKRFSWPSHSILRKIAEDYIVDDEAKNESTVTIFEKVDDLSDAFDDESSNAMIIKKSSKPLLKKYPTDLVQCLDLFKNAAYVPFSTDGKNGIVLNIKDGKFYIKDTKNNVIAFKSKDLQTLMMIHPPLSDKLFNNSINGKIFDYYCSGNRAIKLINKSKNFKQKFILLSSSKLT